MKKILGYLVLSLGLLLGLNAATSNTVQADTVSPLPNDTYDFAVTTTSNLLDGYGNQLPTTVQAGTDWKVFGEFNHSDDTFFRVAPEAFINAKNGYLYQPMSQNVRVYDNEIARLYTNKGELLGQRALGKGTLWYSDRMIIVDKMTYYRVSTSEWASIGNVVPE
ncbi:hypothetical protein [Companilactobacillus kimchiensis]|nr:hypothetical protein [Companilactobacillus kimchiensis]